MRKVVIVTGGSRGIGAAAARRIGGRRLCRRGELCARRRRGRSVVVAAIESAGGEAMAVQGDVSREEDMLRALPRRPKSISARVTALVNNAGMLNRADPASRT